MQEEVKDLSLVLLFFTNLGLANPLTTPKVVGRNFNLNYDLHTKQHNYESKWKHNLDHRRLKRYWI